MSLRTILLFTVAFLLGIIAAQAYGAVHQFSSPVYTDGYELPAQLYSDMTGKAIARPVPSDHLSEDEIAVYKDKVVLDIENAVWAKFTPTHSMDPVLSDTANAIEVVPKSEAEVQEGDIIAYNSEFADGVIIHRVIKKGTDQLGTYYLVQGDNNPTADPGKVRFDQIKSVVVAIVY